MKDLPFIAVGNGELDNNPDVPEIYKCPRCNEEHPVEYGDKVNKDGTKTPDKLLAFVKCRGSSYLIGINGKMLK